MSFQFIYVFLSALVVVLVIVLGISPWSRFGPPPCTKHFGEEADEPLPEKMVEQERRKADVPAD